MLQEKLNDIGRSVREAEKLLREMLAKLERQIALGAVGHFIDELREKYMDHIKIQSYLEAVKEDILSHLEDFKPTEEQAPPQLPFMKMPKQETSFARYVVNVIVNNGEKKGAPCRLREQPDLSQSLRQARIQGPVRHGTDRLYDDQGGFSSQGERRVYRYQCP